MSVDPSLQTFLAYQHGDAHTLETTVKQVQRLDALDKLNIELFKESGSDYYVIVTRATIFHPQGGGQPSDTGIMQSPSGIFRVCAVRVDVVNHGRVLHFGHFDEKSAGFAEGDIILQTIDIEKRLFYSRLHTAGHVLGASVRHLLEHEIPDFDELKASHFPDSASCEFQGFIEAKWKEPIQARLDKYVAKKADVRVEWWSEEELRSRGLERLIPDRRLIPAGEKIRVVNIVGLETYPCGGTHVATTDLCGPVTVRRISRKQGISRVSYHLP
ncbi:uncharacterized protein N7506_005383 [Penicillium brevicompactum]|uniref:uncharacterized protein n=1 Tax=Penicillium brevicompactum TaxID=5074 RepID=UPI002540EEF9|nr:uncharacterized protein N7506_005383 [Penicillium brevicompactum]KAJ5337361.1 hypothetical protein N7506_005383 [Penicillium brevicompactum]